MNRVSKFQPIVATALLSVWLLNFGCEKRQADRMPGQSRDLTPVVDQTDQQRFANDQLSQQKFSALNSKLLQAGRLDIQDVNSLKSIHTKYPGVHRITESLKKALAMIEDWEGIIEMFDRAPAQHVDSQLQVIAHIRSNRFSEAADLLRSKPESLAVTDNVWLLGFSLYHAGRYAEAVKVLEVLENRAPDNRLLDIHSLTGLAYVQLDDDQRAAAAFVKALSLNPDHYSSIVSLAAVLRRLGKTDQAQELDQKALALRSEQTKNDAKAARLNSLILRLNEAWTAQDFDQSREIIEQVLPDADAPLRAKLEAYLNEINKRAK